MDEKSWWDLWNTSYRTKDQNDAVSSELFRRAAATINAITQSRDCSVLEIGCGTGTLSRLLQCSRYHGVDISTAAIGIAQQRSLEVPVPSGARRPTYEVADFHEWHHQAEEMDVVICVDAIAYFRDQRLVMKKIAQILRPGGFFVLTTVNPFVYQRIRRTQWVRLESGPVNNCLSRRQLHALFEQAGLKIERLYTIMPRGEVGFLRIVNSPRLNRVFGRGFASLLKNVKERIGLGQYRVAIARKDS